MRLRPPRGLRVRLVVAFLLVSALSALITAALTFRQARSAILDRTQDNAVHELRAQVDSLAPDLPFPPTTQDLRNFTLQLDRAGTSRDWRTAASYRGGPPVSAPGAERSTAIPAALREAVGQRKDAVVRQRVERDGTPWLVIGMPVLYGTDGEGDRAAASGLVVYADFSLDGDKADIAALVTAAQAGAVPALVIALAPALFAARRVLRPVRGLRNGAEQLASGDLGTRLPVTGHDELSDLTRTFNAMATHLERDDAELRRMEATARRFAADVAHELRTPLAAMAAVTEVLDEDAHSGALPADTADAVLLVSEETRKLTRMVEDLMEVSRFDAGAATLHLDEVALRTLVEKTVHLRGWQVPPGRVVVEVPDDVRVSVDPRRIDVVLANLIGNGLRHGAPPVVVRARHEPGSGPEDPEGGTVVVTVTDHGPGIPDDVLPHVFDRFYKADAARTRSEGSGLGLAIAAENVRLHHGTLTAATSPEGGAEFTLTLPVALPRPEVEEGP
ncbi:two-component sensor histidine kinase [Streptomyces venezuelae]|uniref:histidine kinase n=1 Tax=Streptomyces venezuelae TaxID=54571 RepID=A0A5P2BV34_STRVZ|nr:HAMP domain-containing sensor histidine kinase [Streptomyces venezuelae]QES32279.1 two-component sensor histidine kinase [Streptomyces venezuelae]